MNYTPKRKSQRELLLDILRNRGRSGVTNFELNEICSLRYGARLFELRKLGHNIQTVKEDESRFRFVLKEPPTQERLF